jgi:hypothetical protein
MGKDSIRLLAAIKKRLNFQTQRDSKIRAGIDGNSLGNRWLSESEGPRSGSGIAESRSVKL